MEQKYHEFYRGEIYYADTSSIHMGRTAAMQPVLVLMTDQGHYETPTVVVAEARRVLEPSGPTHVALCGAGILPGRVTFHLEASHAIDKRRVRKRAGRLNHMQMQEIDAALRAVYYLENDGYLPAEIEAP